MVILTTYILWQRVEDRSPYYGSTHYGYTHSIYFDSWSRSTLLTMLI